VPACEAPRRFTMPNQIDADHYGMEPWRVG
jgi:hypothetical protein